MPELHVRFLGEQDGIPERELKEELGNLFLSDRRIRAAYLARTDFGADSVSGVTLCLATTIGQVRPGWQGIWDRLWGWLSRSEECKQLLVHDVGNLFSPRFTIGETLDILFLTHEQEGACERVCHPFFVRR